MDLWYSLTSQFGTPAVIIAIGLIVLGVYSLFFSGKGKVERVVILDVALVQVQVRVHHHHRHHQALVFSYRTFWFW